MSPWSSEYFFFFFDQRGREKGARDAWLVCYCGCPHAESGQLAQKLAGKGFSKVTVLDEGLGFWKNRKFETRSGQQP